MLPVKASSSATATAISTTAVAAAVAVILAIACVAQPNVVAHVIHQGGVWSGKSSFDQTAHQIHEPAYEWMCRNEPVWQSTYTMIALCKINA